MCRAGKLSGESAEAVVLSQSERRNRRKKENPPLIELKRLDLNSENGNGSDQ